MPFLRERSGRWSPIKITAFTIAVLPALWLAWQALTDELGPRPFTEAIHQAGDWALRLLLMTLAVTPLQRILAYPRLILARRTLGVACACYAVLHLSLYILDQHFDLIKVASEIVLRVYLLIGALALTTLIALASTSTDAAIHRLGAQRWQALHRLVYVIAPLAVVHFFIQSKRDIYETVLMGGLLAWLLAYRVFHRRYGRVTVVHLLILAIGASALAALGEAALYIFTSGVDGTRVLLSHLDFDVEVRPAWWVLAVTLPMAALAFWRRRGAPQRPSARRISATALAGATQVQSGS